MLHDDPRSLNGPQSHRRSRAAAGIAVGLAATLAVAGCGTSGDTTAAAGPLATAPAATRLAGVCPDTISIQYDWEPEADHAAAYRLVGPGYQVDKTKKQVTGPLVDADGRDTGVKINIRSGGAAIGFQSVQSQMYVDRSIMLGTVNTDGAIAASATTPVTAVVATMRWSPQILMWDPASHPDWKTIGDIGKAGGTVVVDKSNSFPQMLVSKGLLTARQLDRSYDGAPARFVANPKIAQQGFATAEPYVYQHEVKAWNKPVKYQLLRDVGYTVYPEPLTVRTGDLQKNSACLKKLVPIIQAGEAAYLKDPAPTNKIIVDLVQQYNDSWVYSAGVADYAAGKLKSIGLMGNDVDGSIGSFDDKRVASTLKTFGPILAKGGAKVKPGLSAKDLYTNEFIDSSIKDES